MSTKHSAIEAAAKGMAFDQDGDGAWPHDWDRADQDQYRHLARAAILAYLSALAEDEGAVEACARTMATEDERDPDGPTYVIGAMMPDRPVWRDYEAFARAVLRTSGAIGSRGKCLVAT
jgi:hypothetical protein